MENRLPATACVLYSISCSLAAAEKGRLARFHNSQQRSSPSLPHCHGQKYLDAGEPKLLRQFGPGINRLISAKPCDPAVKTLCVPARLRAVAGRRQAS